ncbi:hypothetical protein [Nakamurella leprariae]|uniref:Uncharacterized protein n=1 Tax=Nakamurella leprariae TaxID=2803911 RepID=A0A939C200_9ACTN|nr:hypothetical protein [Nakamurella leprariae]MBM9467637.1 hypothetical protein [Nakamurella leprariae]
MTGTERDSTTDTSTDTSTDTDEVGVERDAVTDRGEEAEQAGYRGNAVYSGGEFAGGRVPADRPDGDPADPPARPDRTE